MLNTTSGDATAAVDPNKCNIQLNDSDPAMLDGADSEPARISLKIIIRMADIMGARELMDVCQAHTDGAWYGPGPVAFGKDFVTLAANSKNVGGLSESMQSLIPVILGLEHLQLNNDDFKAFSAAFATSSSAPMFHMLNLTSEAPPLEAVCCYGIAPQDIDVDWKDLDTIWDEFNHGSEPRRIDLISFGNPHFSLREIKEAAKLSQGRIKKDNFAVIVTCCSAQYSVAL
ncbi:hypothetical protein BDV41DRAFT_579390 [Aspergillus transmontanensis]|uniref:Phosphomevalonate dehydratase large subunit-like domain-containing protein n=1 Tax=Aspergillus transmontanensis TaxID=1034304 RepID=A0A5N6VPN1_9EURO|nr:hypothetical protein BDV41DRAFT_579390 [Aspergillus transmontanensis]